MTQDEVKKVLELTSSIKDAQKCLYLLENRVVGSPEINNGECMRIGLWMRDNLAVSIPAVEEYINKLQSELDAL